MTNLQNVDLNLLVCLDALLEEGSVTRAARRVGLSQPAMSNALGRLRRTIGDPLLVRSSQGMVPTPRALELAGPVREALSTIEKALSETGVFEPATARRRFAVATNDYSEMVLLPRLAGKVSVEAPGVDLSVQVLGELPQRALESGDCDLAIGVFRDVPGGFYQQALFRDRFVCAVRKGHPMVGDTLDVDTYVALQHVLISSGSRGPGVVDMALDRIGKERRVALRVPHFVVAPLVLSQTDYVLTLASRVARAFADALQLRLFPPPVELPEFTIRQVWHQRFQHDPAHKWLREAIASIAHEVGEPQ